MLISLLNRPLTHFSMNLSTFLFCLSIAIVYSQFLVSAICYFLVIRYCNTWFRCLRILANLPWTVVAIGLPVTLYLAFLSIWYLHVLSILYGMMHMAAHLYLLLSGLYMLSIFVCIVLCRLGVDSARSLISEYLQYHKVEYGQNNLRTEFRRLVSNHQWKPAELTGYHPHPGSAAARTVSEQFIEQFTYEVQLEPYSISMSSRDQRRGLDGERVFYFTKDMNMQVYWPKAITSKHLVKLLDVEYYLSEDRLINTYPVLSYAFRPTRVAGTNSEYSYRFVCKDTVHMVVNGNRDGYTHKLWNLTVDHASRFEWFPMSYYMSMIEYAPIAGDRVVSLIVPSFQLYGLPALVAYLSIGTAPLKRVQIDDHGDVLSSTFMHANRQYHSLGYRDQELYSDCVVPSDIFTSALKTYTEKNDLSSFQRLVLSSLAPDELNPGLPTMAAVLIRLCCGTSWFSKPEFLSLCTPHYVPIFSDLPFENGKSMGYIWCKPFFDATWLPCKGFASDIACSFNRVERPKKKTVKFTADIERYMVEFVELLVPELLNQIPDTTEEVNENQNRPTQRNLYERARDSLFYVATHIKSFQKGEAYPSVNDPRNITTLDTTSKITYSAFIYVYAREVLKKTTWYAFGLSPRDLANCVHEFLFQLPHCILTDFSRFDGTINIIFRRLELMILKRVFAPAYHQLLEILHSGNTELKGVTSFGVRYDSGQTRLSGSPDTAAMNSTDNAFAAYVALRLEGFSKEEAWQRLGRYGGDDGISRGMKECWVRACQMLGLEVKIEIVKNGGSVPFLGRIYTNGFHSPASMIDFKRMIAKLHVTFAQERDIKVIANRKALSLKWSDSKTPFIGAWARAVLRLTTHLKANDEHVSREEQSWYYRSAKIDGNLDKKFPQPNWNESASIIIEQFNDKFTPEYLKSWEKYFESATEFEQLVNLQQMSDDGTWGPIFGILEPEVKLPVVLGGEIRGKPQPAPINYKNNMITTAPVICCIEGCENVTKGSHPICVSCYKTHRCPNCTKFRRDLKHELCFDCSSLSRAQQNKE
jgi:hypothetical protein